MSNELTVVVKKELVVRMVSSLASLEIPARKAYCGAEHCGGLSFDEVYSRVERELQKSTMFVVYEGRDFKMRWGKELGPDLGSLTTTVSTALLPLVLEKDGLVIHAGPDCRRSIFDERVVEVVVKAIKTHAAKHYEAK